MKYLNAAMLLSVVFPYVQIIPLDSYTQPYPFILAIVIIISRLLQNRSIFNVVPKNDLMIFIGFAILGVVLFATTCYPYNNSQEYKYLINYIGTPLLILAIVSILKDDEKMVFIMLKYGVLIWCSVAAIQSLIYPSFLVSILGVESATAAAGNMIESGRGVFGLASEPTHHGFFMIILGGTLAIINSPKWLIYSCVFDALIMAKSSSTLLCLLLALIIVIGANSGKQFIISLISTLFIASSLVFKTNFIMLLPDNRIGFLMNNFMSDPFNFLSVDYSVNVRIGGAIATIIYSFESNLIPHGLSYEDWVSKSTILMNNFPWLISISDAGPPSGFGIILYQCGILGIPFILWFIMQILRPKTSYLGFLLSLTGVFIFFCQYNISSPGFALLYACSIHRVYGKVQIEEGHKNLQET